MNILAKLNALFEAALPDRIVGLDQVTDEMTRLGPTALAAALLKGCCQIPQTNDPGVVVAVICWMPMAGKDVIGSASTCTKEEFYQRLRRLVRLKATH